MNQNTFSKKVHLSTYSQDKGPRITLPLNSVGLIAEVITNPKAQIVYLLMRLEIS